MSDNTDYGALLRDALSASTKTDNLAPLLVDALIVVTVSACTLGVAMPSLLTGYTAMCLRIARGEKVAVGDSMKGFERFGSTLVIGLLVLGLFVVASLLPLIGNVAALILATWVWCVHIDRPDAGAVETLKASVELVRGHPIDTLVLWLVAGGLGTLLSATVIGSVVALAYGVMLTALMYRRWSF